MFLRYFHVSLTRIFFCIIHPRCMVFSASPSQTLPHSRRKEITFLQSVTGVNITQLHSQANQRKLSENICNDCGFNIINKRLSNWLWILRHKSQWMQWALASSSVSLNSSQVSLPPLSPKVFPVLLQDPPVLPPPEWPRDCTWCSLSGHLMPMETQWAVLVKLGS